jgi:hypothetical protein
MFANRIVNKVLTILIVIGIVAAVGGSVHAAEKKKDKHKGPYAMDETTLQSHVMSFADRFASIMISAFAQYETQKLSKKSRREVQAMVTYSMSNAYIIAGESDPDVALLDIISMVTLGRIIFEEEGPKRFGRNIQPIIQGFQRAENDIKAIAARVLTAEQIKNLRIIVRKWRQNNPEVIFFPLVRFSNFAADRRESKLARADDPEGIFESVEVATEQAEEMRLLAERGMYLATRMPQLWGLFGELWITRLLDNPDLKTILADLSQLIEVSSRLATTAEDLPDQITKERKATIKQAMESVAKERSAAITQFISELSSERKAAISDFFAEEERIKGLLSDLKQTLETGNELIVSANALMANQAKPFNIEDYQKTLVELSNSAQELTKLATSVERISNNIGVDQLIPQVVKAMDKAGSEGEELASHTMRLILVVIGVWFVAYVIARLVILYISNKINNSVK